MGSQPKTPNQLVRQYQTNPRKWIHDWLGRRITNGQAEVAQSVADNRETAVKTHHSWGKSMIAAAIVLWFINCFRGSRVITTAPTLKQVAGILWSEIGQMHAHAPRVLPGTPIATQLVLGPGWDARGITARETNPDAFQGFHAEYMLAVVDEAAGVSSKIYQAIDSLVTSHKSRLLHIGNPTFEGGDFGNAFKRPGVSKFTASAFDHDNLTHFGITLQDIKNDTWRQKLTGPYPWPSLVTAEWVHKHYLKWGGENGQLFQSRVLAMFPANTDDAIVPQQWVEMAFDRHEETDWSAVKEFTVGMDVAREGPDNTVLTECCALGVKSLNKFPKGPTTHTVGLVSIFLQDWHAEIRVDADGLGAGVYDMLKEQHGEPVIDMHGGKQARDPDKFFNSRSEWIWNLRELLDPDQPHPIALPRDDNLMASLCNTRWAVNSKGKIQVEPKKEFQQRMGYSPDEMDSCAYGLADLHSKDMLVVIDPSMGYSPNPWDI